MGYATYLLFLSGFIYILWIWFNREDFPFLSKGKCENNFDREQTQNLRHLLETNFIVYKLLDATGREQFEKRICRFIKKKTFRTGKNLQVITDEMRVMVAAASIQITYGYPDVYFTHFETIILFKDEYYSSLTGQYHEGEVNAAGAIVLSWKNFLSGFSNPNDGRNLALHEMAHALRLTNIVDNEEYDFIDRQTMLNFEEIAQEEMLKINENGDSFFRLYGATNQQEFFAVAVECFFEKPKEFKDYNPDLYFLLTKILKLDILNLI